MTSGQRWTVSDLTCTDLHRPFTLEQQRPCYSMESVTCRPLCDAPMVDLPSSRVIISKSLKNTRFLQTVLQEAVMIGFGRSSQTQ